MTKFFKSAPALLVAVITFVVFAIGLQFPSHPDDLTWGHFDKLPLELLLAVAVLVASRGWVFNLMRFLMVCSLGVFVLLRLADLGSEFALGRKFSPLTEWHLVGQGWSLASSTLGGAEAVSWAVAGVLVLLCTCCLLFKGLLSLRDVSRKIAYGFLAVLIFSSAAQAYANFRASDQENISVVQFTAVKEISERISAIKRQVQDQLDFQELMLHDPLQAAGPPKFNALQGMDVVFIFVESYGRSFIDSQRFSERADVTLKALQEDVSQAGLYSASGWLDSPVRGGRSWLAHATLGSGLPLTNHARFDRLMSSDRTPLWSLFEDAGWESAVVLPAVHDKWSEAEWYGVDRFFNAPSLGYKGEDFGYVTMPDQYTLSAFEKHVRETAKGPIAAEIGLLSSHAPWTPLALPVPWDEIGDGEIFDGTQRFGEPWDWGKGGGPVREMYARSLELSLQIMGEYLQRYTKNTLFIIAGDHQPASIIDGWAPNAHVPVHFVTDNPDLLQRLPGEQFREGIVPDTDALALPMAGVRELLGTVFE